MRTNLFIMVLAIALAIAVLAAGNSQQSLEVKLGNLSQELVDANYSWLVNYTGGVESVFYLVLNKFKYVNDYTIE